MYLVWIIFFIFLLNSWNANVESLLLNLQKPCVPTESVKGPCHTCVCNTDAVFDCQAVPCGNINVVNPRISIKDECEPHMTYRFEELFCTCNYKGRWMSYNCRETFQFLRSDRTIGRSSLRSNITCTPNSLVLVDCNICRCDDTGLTHPLSCTNRHCIKGHKADLCKFGDFLRTNEEVCICSDINFYIDRLCVKVEAMTVQEINKTRVAHIVTNVNPSRKSMINDSCLPRTRYTIDCNNCICDDKGELVCTNKVCENEKKQFRTSDTKNDFFNLPKAESENDSCKPGRKYRLKCNTCICTDKFTLSCTTMVCLENFIFDEKSLSLNF